MLLNQLKAIEAAGYEVAVICNPGPYVGDSASLGLRVIPVPIVRAALTPLRDLLALVRIYFVFRRERPDIVHTHAPKAALLGQYAALLAGVSKRIHTIHGLYLPGHMTARTRPLFLWMERLIMRFAHLTLSQNPEDIPLAVSEGICRADRIRYLGNGIDVGAFNPAKIDTERRLLTRHSMRINSTDFVIGVVARLNAEKGFEELFEAVAGVVKEIGHVKLLIVGPQEPDKPNRIDPAKLAKLHGITDNIRCVGLRHDMADMYSVMDICVLPSHREGWPRSLMEAAAMGVPVIATDIRGCRQVVEHHKTGVLVPVKDVTALRNTIRYLFHNDEVRRRMGRAAQLHAEAHFDERAVFHRVLESYAELTKDPSLKNG